MLNNIKNLKIQVAENIAIEAVNALYHIIHRSRKLNAKGLLEEIREAANQLLAARPTEPCTRNALNYILSDLSKDDIVELVITLDKKIRYVKNHIQDVKEQISIYGSKKIKNGTIVFTHCHSSTVIGILKFAHKKGIRFEVHNTETRPLFQGRITSVELSKAGINVKHYVDSAARTALRKADICLIGADAITSEGNVINKIGTELFLEIAEKYEIPTYICADSWKFDSGTIYGKVTPLENRDRDEVWPKAPRSIRIINPAFEIILPEMVSGVISELGIYHPEVFVEEVKRHYPWITKHYF